MSSDLGNRVQNSAYMLRKKKGVGMSQHGSSEYSIEHFHTNVPAFVAFG